MIQLDATGLTFKKRGARHGTNGDLYLILFHRFILSSSACYRTNSTVLTSTAPESNSRDRGGKCAGIGISRPKPESCVPLTQSCSCDVHSRCQWPYSSPEQIYCTIALFGTCLMSSLHNPFQERGWRFNFSTTTAPALPLAPGLNQTTYRT